MGSTKKGGAQVAVVDYTMSMHYGVAISADALTGIYAQQKTVWEGNVGVNCKIDIDNASLFGGAKAQGGMVGQVHVMFGGPAQIAPLQLAKRLTIAAVALTQATCPAFRGLMTLLFCSDAGGGFHFQYNSPQIPPLSFKLQRTPRAAALNPAFASIPARGAAANRLVAAGFNENITDPDTGLPIVIVGDGPTYGPTIPDANPAHIIYELLTNTDWGMGLSADDIETSTFEAAAEKLFGENLGLSVIWTSQDTIDALVTQILGTIQGAIYTRPSTGKFELKLFRQDYWTVTDTGAIFTSAGDLNPANATITSFSRKLPGELANEVVVDWTNPLTEQTESVTIQDPGSIANQNGIISQRSTYPGVRNEILAAELGMRDLRSVGAPLGVIEATVDRTLWTLVPGDIVTVTYPEYGLDGLVCRIAKIDYGKPGDSIIKVNLMEDIFASGMESYIIAPPPSWEDPKKDPAPATLVLPLTLPMYMLLNLGDSGVAAGRAFPEVTVGMIAAPPVTSSSSFELEGETTDSLGNVTDADLGTKVFMAHGVSTSALPREAASAGFIVGDLVGYGAIPVGGFLVMGDTDETMEIMVISARDLDVGTVSLVRGLFDTIPRAWPVGTPFFLLNQPGRIDDPIGRAAGDALDYKLLTIAGGGRLKPAAAPVVPFTPTERPFLPNRPGNVTVAGSPFADVDLANDDDIVVTWANRNRTIEETRIVHWNDGDILPEAGQTTSIIVWPDALDTPLTTIDGLTGTSHDLPVTAFGSETSGYVQVAAKRGGLQSLQAFMIRVGLAGTSVDNTGYGWNYGNAYGGAGAGPVLGGDWIVIHNDTSITIDGLTWQTLNADTGHSLLYSPSLGLYKYEVFNGENYHVGAPWDDPPITMRSEVLGPSFPFDDTTTFTFGVKVLSGQEPTTNQWFIIGQIHVGAFVGVGGSPPVALDVRPDGAGGEKWQLDYNYQPIGTSTITYTNLGSMPGFQRDTHYVSELIYKDDHGGPNGYIKWTVDGVVIVNYTGVTGYSSATTGSYPKFGIYTGGNGVTLDPPLPGQDICVIYDNITFRRGGGTPPPGATLLGTATLVGKDGWEFHAELPAGTHTLYAEITNPDGTKVQTAHQTPIAVSGANPSGAVIFNPSQSVSAIQAAVTAGGAGAKFVFTSGTYRDISITPLANQTFIGKGGVTFTGSIPITGWTLSGGYYQAAGFPADNYAPGGSGDVGPRGVIALIPNDLYWNGVSYLRVATKAEVAAGKFYVDGSHIVYVTDNPAGVTTTAGHRSEAFFGGSDPISAFPPVNGVTIYGITFKEYATPENRGALQFGATSSLKLINCRAYWNHNCGVSCGTVEIYGGDYSSNGQQGVLSFGVSTAAITGTRVTGAIMNSNNNQGFSMGYGAGGFKGLWMTSSLVEYSTFQSNLGTGVWWDTACGGTVNRNTIKNGRIYGVQIEENQTHAITVSSNLLDQNNQDGNWGGLSGTNIFATASSNITYQDNLIIVQNGAASMGLNEDARDPNVINCSVTANLTIVLGSTGANGGASMGEGSPPIFAGSNHWDNNTWVATGPTRITYAWGGHVFNASSPSTQPIDAHATYTYVADPSAYLALLNPTLAIAVHEQLTPGGSDVTNATGFAMLTGTRAGRQGAVVRVYSL